MRVFLNDEQAFKTSIQDTSKGWTSYGDIYYSKRINNETRVRFDVLNYEASLFGEQNQNRGIKDILNSSFIAHAATTQPNEPKKVYLLYTAIWRDEYGLDGQANFAMRHDDCCTPLT